MLANTSSSSFGTWTQDSSSPASAHASLRSGFPRGLLSHGGPWTRRFLSGCIQFTVGTAHRIAGITWEEPLALGPTSSHVRNSDWSFVATTGWFSSKTWPLVIHTCFIPSRWVWAGLSDWLPTNRSHGMSLPWLGYKLWLLSLSLLIAPVKPAAVLWRGPWNKKMRQASFNDQQGAGTRISTASRELNPVNRLLDELGGRSVPGETCNDRLIASLLAVPLPQPPAPSLPYLSPPPLPLSPLPFHLQAHHVSCGLPWWLRQYRIRLQSRRQKLDSWVGKTPWKREWQPTPVFLPGEFHRQRILVGASPWGCNESHTTERFIRLVHTLIMFHVDQWFATFTFKLKCSIFKQTNLWVQLLFETQLSLDMEKREKKAINNPQKQNTYYPGWQLWRKIYQGSEDKTCWEALLLKQEG